MVVGVITACYLWVSYGRMIDARLGGEQRAIPRIFGRPFEMRPGRALEPGQLVQRLNDVGYAERPKACEFCAATRPPARPGLAVGDC